MKEILFNKKANFNYEIIKTYEAGICLKGVEVKSIYQKKVSIDDAYVVIKKNEAYILNMHIAPYEHGNIYNVEPTRTRKLLLHKNEIIKLEFLRKKESITIIPTKLYWKKNKIKILIALCKGKNLIDKRETIKKRDLSREIRKIY